MSASMRPEPVFGERRRLARRSRHNPARPFARLHVPSFLLGKPFIDVVTEMCWFLSFRRRSSSFPRIDTKEFVCVWERAIYFYDGNGTGSCVVFLFVAACRKSTAPLLQRGSRPWPESPLFFVIVLVSTRFYIFIYLLQRQSLASEGIRSSLAGRRWKTGRAARRAAAAISWESLLQSFFLHFHDRHTFRNSFPPNSWRAAGTNKPSNIFCLFYYSGSAHSTRALVDSPNAIPPRGVFFFSTYIFGSISPPFGQSLWRIQMYHSLFSLLLSRLVGLSLWR